MAFNRFHITFTAVQNYALRCSCPMAHSQILVQYS